ncbi:MAG TPA: hypothetical protein VK177_16310 [Flavobacteriales bacterium]|nr:hypothetical protein [Flavobacteriales bacterium]
MKIVSVLLALVILNGCLVRGPRYTTVEKVMTVKPGMSLAQVNEKLTSKPYDIHTYDSLGSKSYIYKYRVADRSTVPFFLKENNGKTVRGKYMDLVAYFSVTDTLIKLESRASDSSLEEKKIDVDKIITFFSVTVPALLVLLGLQNLN